MIECQICKRQLGTLVGKHLKSHSITSKQYQEMFPGHPVSAMKPWTEELRQKQKLVRTGRKHSEETKAKIGARHKGKTRSPEEIEKWRESYKEFLVENGGSPQKGYKRSEEFKDRMSEIAQNRPAELVQAKVEQMWEARRGSKATEEQRENYRDGRLKFMADNPHKLPKQMFNTVPEQEFALILDKLNISYERSFHLGNRVFDFKVGHNILIEIDGPYHRTLGFYLPPGSSDDEKVAKLMGFIERDRLKDNLARQKGYFIYRIPVGQHVPDNWLNILNDQGFSGW